MRKTILMTIAVYATFFGQTLLAQQIFDVTRDSEIVAAISKREVTRLSATADRITQIVKGDLPYTMTHDPDQGDVYFRPEFADITKPINLFVTTEKGFTYKVVLVPKDVPSVHIVLNNPEAIVLGNEDNPTLDAPIHDVIVDLTRGMATGDLLDGFTVEAGVTNEALEKLFPDFAVVVKARWIGGLYWGEEVQVTINPRAKVESAELQPTDFATLPGIAGIWIETPMVNKTSVIHLFIVYRAGG